MDLSTLLASICISGAREKWDNTVEKICDDGMRIADLLFKLKTVERSINPGIDTKVILLPAACLMSDVTVWVFSHERWWLIEACYSAGGKLFMDFFMHNRDGDTPLEEALRVYAEFHILEGQPVEWTRSNKHAFKCNCPHRDTFVSGLAVTMDSCAQWCVSLA